MLQRLLIKIYGPDWKTSIQSDINLIGYLASLVSGITFVTAEHKWYAAIPAGAGLVAKVCGQIVGRLQQDAGSQIAMDKKTGDVVIAESHEVPFDKNLKPIKEEPK